MEDITHFKNEFNGERIFLIGNGPSLRESPLEDLESEYTFGLNKISKIYSLTSWRPDFFFLGNPPEWIENPRKINEDNYIMDTINLGIPCFINNQYKMYLDNDFTNVYYVEPENIKESPIGQKFHTESKHNIKNLSRDYLSKLWSDDISKCVYLYHSMYSVIQIAVYMGFEEIYLIGCDLGYSYLNPHMIFEKGLDPHKYEGGKLSYIKDAVRSDNLIGSLMNGLALKLINSDLIHSILNKFIEPVDEAHFRSDYRNYFKISDQTIVSEEIIKSHILANTICSARDVKIYNATIGGELEVYPRVEIKDVLEN